MKQYLIMSVLIISAFCACNRSNSIPGDKPVAKNYSNQVVLDWNQMAYVAMGGAAYQHSLLASRINAMVHIAMHDAINAAIPKFKTYALKTNDNHADPVVAAANAAHGVLFAAFPEKRASLDSLLGLSEVNVTDTAVLNRGRRLGAQAALAILSLRSNDRALTEPIAPVEPAEAAGIYQPVPPFNVLFAPFWKDMQTFGINSPKQFRVAPHPALNSKVYTDDFEEVKQYGAKLNSKRTSEQTSYAQFWYEFSEAGWNRVARSAIAGRNSDLFNTARLFALLNMAMADAYTAGWDSKFHYNFWRPFTAIRKATDDGNPTTSADIAWEPLMPTPPVQDYPSTHSALGNAAATVLTALLGDNVSFTFESVTAEPPNKSRKFNSFTSAANENADSRVMAGLHFRFSCDAGLQLGEKIGKWILQHHMTPDGQ